MATISDTTYGVYITEEDVGGAIAANTPGSLVLGTEGTDYIYLGVVKSFTSKWVSQREGTDILGWETIQVNSSGKIQGNVGGGARSIYIINAIITEDVGEKLKTLFKVHVKVGASELFLVHQRATTTFEQFPNSAGTLKKYAEIIMKGFDIVESDDAGKNAKVLVLYLEDCHERN